MFLHNICKRIFCQHIFIVLSQKRSEKQDSFTMARRGSSRNQLVLGPRKRSPILLRQIKKDVIIRLFWSLMSMELNSHIVSYSNQNLRLRQGGNNEQCTRVLPYSEVEGIDNAPVIIHHLSIGITL